MTAEVIGLIPARYGSRRVLHKNIVEVCGKPLIAYTLEAARDAKCLTRTIVSTESTEVRDVARRFGGEVPWLRPRWLATDEMETIAVVRHAAKLLVRDGAEIAALVVLQPTSPLRTGKHIDAAYKVFTDETGCDSVVSVGPNGRPNGAVYVLSPRVLFEKVPIQNENTRSYLMEDDVSLDINTWADIKEAECRILGR